MPAHKIYTKQHLAKVITSTPSPMTLPETKLPYVSAQEAIKLGLIRPRKAKGQIVRRRTGKVGKPPVEYVPTITAQSLAKAA